MMCELFNPILDAQNEVTWIWLKKNVHCNVFLDIFSQEIPLLILSYFRVAADFVKKVLGFVYKGSDAQLCITTFVICFEGLWVTTWYYFFSLCELILNLTKNLEEIHLRIMTVTSKKVVYCSGLETPGFREWNTKRSAFIHLAILTCWSKLDFKSDVFITLIGHTLFYCGKP